MRKFSIAVCMLLAATPALAEKWELAGVSTAYANYIDRDSIQADGPTSRIATIRNYRLRAGRVLMDEARKSYDCRRKTITLVSVMGFNANREMVDATFVEVKDRKTIPVAPGSSGEIAFAMVCNNHVGPYARDPWVNAREYLH